MLEIISAIVEIVKDVGFPIACVVAMFWQTEKERQSHRSEMSECTKAINNNTVALEKILTALEGDGR